MAEGYDRAQPFDFQEIDVSNKVASNVSATTARLLIYGPLVIVSVTGLVKSTSSSNWTDMLDLSDYLSPTSLQHGIFTNDSESISQGLAVAEVEINTSGILRIYSPKTNIKYWGTIFLFNR